MVCRVDNARHLFDKEEYCIDISHDVCCRDMFCAGRVPEEDLKRTLQACGGCIQSTVASLEKDDGVLGTCSLFEEKQVGGDRYVGSNVAKMSLVCQPYYFFLTVNTS